MTPVESAMVRKLVITAAVNLLLVSLSAAAIVYTAGGETYKGKVTKEGKKVVVETAAGRVVLDAKQVIHIEHTEPVKDPVVPVKRPTTTQPSGIAPTTRPGGLAPEVLAGSGAMALGKATRPEPIIYRYMRSLAVASAGEDTARIRRQIDLWRAHAHDRLRKSGPLWLAPKDFVRHRAKFTELLSESQRLAKLIGPRRYIYSRTSRSKVLVPLTPKQKRYHFESLEKLRLAGRAWGDIALRHFLLGLAETRAKKYDRAVAELKLSIRSQPLSAGVHQALGIAYAKQKQYIYSLESLLEMLRLRPDSAEALHLVREYMKLVPGRRIKTQLFLRAKKAIASYTTPPRSPTYRSHYTEWLMPQGRSRGWRTSAKALPTPPYDRLEFRQAVGVPLGKQALVVDAEVVDGALDVFVKIDGKFVPAKGSRSYYSTSRARPPISIVYLPDHEVTPLKTVLDAKPAKAGPCKAHAVGTFGQMGRDVRVASGRFSPGGDKSGGKAAVRLLPGEATSPVLIGDGVLAGFITGKIDVTVDGGGGGKFVPLADREIASIIKRAVSSRVSSGSYGGYTMAKRTITPQPAEGKTFLVYSVFGERFKPAP